MLTAFANEYNIISYLSHQQETIMSPENNSFASKSPTTSPIVRRGSSRPMLSSPEKQMNLYDLQARSRSVAMSERGHHDQHSPPQLQRASLAAGLRAMAGPFAARGNVSREEHILSVLDSALAGFPVLGENAPTSPMTMAPPRLSASSTARRPNRRQQLQLHCNVNRDTEAEEEEEECHMDQ